MSVMILGIEEGLAELLRRNFPLQTRKCLSYTSLFSYLLSPHDKPGTVQVHGLSAEATTALGWFSSTGHPLRTYSRAFVLVLGQIELP